jgi:uncharacterized membrane protein YjjP (DUF1212 family)
MTLEERSNLVLAFARVLYINGQSTAQTVAAAERLGGAVGLRASLLPRWGELQLLADEGDARLISTIPADPAGVNMDRVVSAMRVMEEVEACRMPQAAVLAAIGTIAQKPPAPAWMFALAAGAGAVALAVLFGVQHLVAAALILVSAAAGAGLRRGLARYSANMFLQPFCAALLAGIIGGLAVRWDLSSSLRLVAVCPCMVLVPGPHVLNGALDVIKGRVHLGGARLLYAACVIVAISMGLLLGLALLGVGLPVDEAGRDVVLWQDVIAAGVAVAAYGVFFSMKLDMLGWPVGVGMVAHAMRWVAIGVVGTGAATGAMIACLVVGLVLTPVARRCHVPFAAIGFASVVSMVPGVFLFRMASGVLQLADGSRTTLPVLSGTIADGMTAMLIILAMSFGLIVPKLAIDWIAENR